MERYGQSDPREGTPSVHQTHTIVNVTIETDRDRERNLLQLVELISMALMFFLDKRHALLAFASSLTLLEDLG